MGDAMNSAFLHFVFHPIIVGKLIFSSGNGSDDFVYFFLVLELF